MKIRAGWLTATGVLACASAHAQLTQIWSLPYAGSAGGVDKAVSVLADIRGNTISVGYAAESGGGGTDIVLIKYSPSGSTTLWAAPAQWDNPTSHLADVATAAALDRDGNIYVCGSTQTGTQTTDMIVVKFDGATGVPVWSRQIDIGEDKNEVANDIAIDKNGYLYVTGLATGSTSGSTWVTVKIDGNSSDGAVQSGWPKLYASGGLFGAIGVAVRESTGHVYVTGQIIQDLNEYWMTCRYPGGGTTGYNQEDWTRFEVGDFAPKSCRPYDIAVDASGHVFVCGYVAETGTNTNYRTTSYDTDGNDRWTIPDQDLDIGALDRATALGIAYDPAGDALYCYVTGWVGPDDEHSYGTVKYRANSALVQQLWYTPYTVSGQNNQAFSIAVGGAGNAYVTGFHTISGNRNYATLQYDISGTQVGGVAEYPGSGDDEAAKVVNSCAGLAHVTGFQTPSTEDYRTLTYNQPSRATTIAADSTNCTLSPGQVVSGSLDDLATSNDARFVIRPGTVFSNLTWPAAIVMEVTSPSASPSEVCCLVECQSSTAVVHQRVEFWNYSAGFGPSPKS